MSTIVKAGDELAGLVETLERAEVLDATSSKVREIASKVFANENLRDAASGVPLAHPLHPALVVTPIGFWTGAVLLDFRGGRQKAARTLTGLGVLAAAPAALTGWSDWMDTDGAEQRVGLVHGLLNGMAIGTFALSWWKRRRGDGHILSLLGAAMVGVSGWLGGHLAYGLGVGVDTNSFQSGPEDWTEVEGVDPSTPGLACGVADGVRLVVIVADGNVHVLADRCSHRGGPLSDGKLVDGCVECPWHGSRFDASSGRVRRGPATLPQPTYETRVVEGKLQVRRSEVRSLRKNPVRAR